MKIPYYTRRVYGKSMRYIADTEIASTIHQLTQKTTLFSEHMKALEALGFTFEHVIDPEMK